MQFWLLSLNFLFFKTKKNLQLIYVFEGVVVTDDNRVIVAGGNYVYHEYKLFHSLSKNEERRSTIEQSKTNKKKDSDFASISHEKDNFYDGF